MTSAPAVRARLAALPDGRVPRGLVGDCQLIATELVSNAVNAHADWVDVDLLLFDDHLELQVRDQAGGVPIPQEPSVTDTGGRGLRIVDAISSAWGFRTEPDRGKTVWARLNLPAGL